MAGEQLARQEHARTTQQKNKNNNPTAISSTTMAPSSLTRKLVIAGGNHAATIWDRISAVFFECDDDKCWSLVRQRLSEIVHPVDLAFLIAMSSLSLFVPQPHQPSPNQPPSTFKSEDVSYFNLLLIHVAQLARLSLVIYAVDCGVVVLDTLGVQSAAQLHLWSTGLAKILYILWTAHRLSALKRYCLDRVLLTDRNRDGTANQDDDQMGRVHALNRLVDGGILACTIFVMLDVLNVDMGMSGVTSIFAFGSAGTLVVGLASQNLATMFVNGLLLTTSDRIFEGDYIVFGHGQVCGKIIKIGWFQTTLRHYDDLVEVIPNSELGMQRVTNLSRVKRCRVKQTLRFAYKDADRLDVVLKDILEEITASCPKAITDGSAVLRAVWTDFKEDHIKAVVEAHFSLVRKETRWFEFVRFASSVSKLTNGLLSFRL